MPELATFSFSLYSGSRHTVEFSLSASLPFSSASLCPRCGQKENIIPPTCVILTTPWAPASKRNNRHFLCVTPPLVVSVATIIVVIAANGGISEITSQIPPPPRPLRFYFYLVTVKSPLATLHASPEQVPIVKIFEEDAPRCGATSRSSAQVYPSSLRN